MEGTGLMDGQTNWVHRLMRPLRRPHYQSWGETCSYQRFGRRCYNYYYY